MFRLATLGYLDHPHSFGAEGFTYGRTQSFLSEDQTNYIRFACKFSFITCYCVAIKYRR
ncbi:unnamed protein product, partial [Vitis vinifera]|uniref:Uncharacterized protein n=1 Tax=Vitis vinifera TaxID=29760 RepID=D7SWB1_VITVI